MLEVPASPASRRGQTALLLAAATRQEACVHALVAAGARDEVTTAAAMEGSDDALAEVANAGGVVGLLEVIQADFARLEAETTTAEDTVRLRAKQLQVYLRGHQDGE